MSRLENEHWLYVPNVNQTYQLDRVGTSSAFEWEGSILLEMFQDKNWEGSPGTGCEAPWPNFYGYRQLVYLTKITVTDFECDSSTGLFDGDPLPEFEFHSDVYFWNGTDWELDEVQSGPGAPPAGSIAMNLLSFTCDMETPTISQVCGTGEPAFSRAVRWPVFSGYGQSMDGAVNCDYLADLVYECPTLPNGSVTAGLAGPDGGPV